MKLVFLGTTASAGFRSFAIYGQAHEIPPREAFNLIKAGIALLPQAVFDTAGFTRDELKRFCQYGTWPSVAAGEFNVKRSKISGVFQVFKNSLLKQGDFNEALKAVLPVEGNSEED